MNKRAVLEQAFIGFYKESDAVKALVISKYPPLEYNIVDTRRCELEARHVIEILGRLIEPKHIYKELVKVFIREDDSLFDYAGNLTFVGPNEVKILVQAYKSYLFNSGFHSKGLRTYINEMFVKSETTLSYDQWLKELDLAKLPFVRLLEYCAKYTESSVPLEPF